MAREHAEDFERWEIINCDPNSGLKRSPWLILDPWQEQTNKSLAQNNKSCADSKATKKSSVRQQGFNLG
jgi:hypothetical protein